MSSKNTKINVHEAHELANAFKNIDVHMKNSNSRILNHTKLNGVDKIEEMLNNIPKMISELCESTIDLANELPNIASQHANLDSQNAVKIKKSNFDERKISSYARNH